MTLVFLSRNTAASAYNITHFDKTIIHSVPADLQMKKISAAMKTRFAASLTRVSSALALMRGARFSNQLQE